MISPHVEYLVQGECWNRTDNVANGETNDVFAHSIDNTGGFIS